MLAPRVPMPQVGGMMGQPTLIDYSGTDVINGLVQRGAPPVAATGIAGNVYAESRYNPGINEIAPVVPGSRGGWGLAQWTGPRRRQFESFAQERGAPLDDFDTQLDFLMWELNNTESRARDAIFAAQTPEEAARLTSEMFLRPGIPHLDTRIAEATRLAGGGGLLAGGGGSDTVAGNAGGDTMAGLLAPQEPARRPSIWDRLEGVPILGGLADPDRRARLAVGLGGMSLNPNAMLMASNMQGIEQRAQERETTARMNQTIAYLQSVGRDDLVALVQAGMDPGSALQESARQPETAEPTSLMQNYDFLIAQGYTPEQALAAVQSGTIVNVGGTEQPMTGAVPAGFARVPDLNNPDNPSGFRDIPIPGGSADPTATDAVAAGNADIATNTITTAAARAREAAQERTFTGPMGAVMSYARNSDNAELYRQVEVLKSNAITSNLQAMRDASPTGGALGAVTAPELDLLAAKSGALDPQSPNFLRDLDDYEYTLLTTIHGPNEGRRIYEATRGNASAGPSNGDITTSTLPPTSQDIQSILDKYPAVP